MKELLHENPFSSVKQEAKILTESSKVESEEQEIGRAETPAMVSTSSDGPAGIRIEICSGATM